MLRKLVFFSRVLRKRKKAFFSFTDDFYKNDDDDGEGDDFVEETSELKLSANEESSLTKLLNEDTIGQLTAVHNKYHQLKCQYHATRKF